MSDPDYIFNNTLDSSDILDVSAITGLDLDLSSSSDIIPGGIRGFDNIDNEAEYINSKKTDFIFSSEDNNSRSMTTRSSKSRSIGLKFHESDERSSMFGARRNLVNTATNMSIIAHNGSRESLSVSLQEASKINEVSSAFSDPSTTTKTSILKPIELRTSTPTPTSNSFLTSASVDRSATSATGSATKLQHEPKPKFSANISILSTTNNSADVQLEMKLPGINAVSSSTSCSAGANYLQELGAGLFTIGQNSTVNIYVSKCVNCTGKSGCGVQPVPLPISAKEATTQSDQGPSRINIIANNAENCNLLVANPHGDGEIQENELLEESESEPSPTLPTYINSNNTSPTVPTPTPTPSNTVISPLIPCNDNDINSNFNSFIVRRARFNPYLTPKEPVVIDKTETQDDTHSRSHTMVVHLQDSSTPTPTPTHINSTMPVESSQVLSSLKRRGPGRPRKQTKTKSLKTSKVPQTDNDSDNNFTSANNNSTVLSNLALLDTSQLENIVQTSVLASLNSLKSLAGSHVINLVVNVGCSNSYSRNDSDNAVAGVAAAASNTKLHCKCKSKIKTSISVPVPASAKEDSTPSTCAVVNTSKQKNVVPTVSKSKCKRSSRLQKDKTPSVPRSAVGVLFNKVHSGIKNIPNVNNDGININHGHNSVEPNRYERRKRSRSPNNSSDSNSNDTEFQNYLQFSSSYLKPQTMRNVLGAGAEGELASCNGARKTVSEKSESSESESDDDDSGKPKDNTKVTETDLGLDLNPISNLDGPDGPRKKSIKLKKYSDLVKKYATKNKKIPMQIIRKQFDYTKQGFYLCKVEGCMCAVKHAQSLRRHWFTHVLQEEDDDMNSDSDISDDGLDSYTSVNTTHTKTKTTKTGLHSHNNSRDSYNYDLDLSFGSESDLDLDSDDSESYQSYQRAETESNERLKRRRAQGGLKKHLSQKKLILD